MVMNKFKTIEIYKFFICFCYGYRTDSLYSNRIKVVTAKKLAKYMKKCGVI